MGELSQPTVYNGVMYVVNGNWTFAIDIATGRQIWRTPVTYDRAALRVTTGGAYLRGHATIYNGKLYRQNIDGHVAALDMKTGKEIWKTKFGEWKESYGGIVQPTIVNGVPMLDLCYQEDSQADVDMNVVMTGSGQFVELQATAEKTAFDDGQLSTLLTLALCAVTPVLPAAQSTGGSGDTSATNDTEYGFIVFQQNCTSCHSRIHGSNADARFFR